MPFRSSPDTGEGLEVPLPEPSRPARLFTNSLSFLPGARYTFFEYVVGAVDMLTRLRNGRERGFISSPGLEIGRGQMDDDAIASDKPALADIQADIDRKMFAQSPVHIIERFLESFSTEGTLTHSSQLTGNSK